ncbi:FAD-dependent oxidoreductase [Candidatus Woesearchaeota archaeon]|nr:FAD-dependent oxidoreductase [Candidatus Woesearchaeota archaeon]
MKKIIIIGGGFAGAYIARQLESEFAVTLFDTKDYFEFTPSVLRTLVEPRHLPKIEVPHQAYLQKAVIVRKPVMEVADNKVIAGGMEYLFDYLVIASGSRYTVPIKEENIVIAARGRDLQQWAHQLEKAKKVLIVGGGIVGTELAAEIVDRFPEKEITLVHSKKDLLDRNPRKAKEYARRFLQQRGIKLIFEEKVIDTQKERIPTAKKYITNKRGEIFADLAFLCTGIVPNSEFLKKNEKISLAESGFVQVNAHLQVANCPNIFAAGDITNIKEEKTAQAAEKQAEVVIDNIRALAAGRKLREYASKARPMVISLGKWKGILVYRQFVWTGFFPGLLKRLIEWKTMHRYR